MAVPYTFGSATTSIPLSQLDSNFATTITLGNTAIQLGNTVTTLNNMTLANVTITSGTSSFSSIANGTSNVTVNSSGGNITLGTAGTTAVTIDTSQNVGIGTTSVGTFYGKTVEISNTNDCALKFTNTQTGFTSSDGTYVGLLNSGATDFYLNNRESGNMLFQTSNAERMRIDSSGNVFMADTTLYPGDGNTATGLMFQASAGKLFVSASGGNTAFSYNLNGTGTIGYFCSSGTRVGNIGVTGSTTSYNSGSDYRLKNNVQPLTNALSKVALLKPSSWSWKADNSYGDGFIAHELAEVCPNAVNGTKDELDANGNPVYQGVDTSFLVATLTAAIQELKAINDTQAETINALTARIVALEK